MERETVKIHPSTQRRIDLMRRRQAEERADMHASVALKAIDRSNRLTAEKMRLEAQNALLMETLHAIAGWPRRLMLPFSGGQEVAR